MELWSAQSSSLTGSVASFSAADMMWSLTTSARILPSRRMMLRLEYCAISGLWVTKMMVRPSACSSWKSTSISNEVLAPEPYYPNYDTFVRVTGAAIRPIPTSAEEGYRFASREKIEPLINEHTRAILMTNPGNPTGVVLRPEERRLMADIAKEHGLFLISDEVYRELVYGGGPQL